MTPVPVTDEHIAELIPDLGDYAIGELQALDGDYASMIRSAVDRSADAWAIVDKRVLAIGGVIDDSLMNGSTMIWVLCSKHCGIAFGKHSKIWVAELLKLYPLLWAWVEIGNPKTARWVEWLGFEGGEPFIQSSKVYRQFWKRAY